MIAAKRLELETKIAMVERGLMLPALELELQLLNEKTFEQSSQNHRFIIN
jgi:hypothetical protein